MEIRLARSVIRDRLRARLALPAEPQATISDQPAAVRARVGLPDTASATAVRSALRASVYSRAGDSAVAALTTLADTQVNELLIAANKWGRLNMPWAATALDLASDVTTSDVDGELVVLAALTDYLTAAGDVAAAGEWKAKRDQRLAFLQIVEGPRIPELLMAAERLAYVDDETRVLFACAETARHLGMADKVQSFERQLLDRLERKQTQESRHLNALLDEGALTLMTEWNWARTAAEQRISVPLGTRYVTLPAGCQPENIIEAGWWDGDAYRTLQRYPITVALDNDASSTPSQQYDTPLVYQVRDTMELWPIPDVAGEVKITYTVTPQYAADGDTLPLDAEMILLWAAHRWCVLRDQTAKAQGFAQLWQRRGEQLRRFQSGVGTIAPGRRQEAAVRRTYREPRPNYYFGIY